MIYFKSALEIGCCFLIVFSNKKPYTEDNQKKIEYLESAVYLLVEVVVVR